TQKLKSSSALAPLPRPPRQTRAFLVADFFTSFSGESSETSPRTSPLSSITVPPCSHFRAIGSGTERHSPVVGGQSSSAPNQGLLESPRSDTLRSARQQTRTSGVPRLGPCK